LLPKALYKAAKKLKPPRAQKKKFMPQSPHSDD